MPVERSGDGARRGGWSWWRLQGPGPCRVSTGPIWKRPRNGDGSVPVSGASEEVSVQMSLVHHSSRQHTTHSPTLAGHETECGTECGCGYERGKEHEHEKEHAG